MLANNVVSFAHLYNMFVMHKNVGQHFGYLIRDEIISNVFEDIAYKKLMKLRKFSREEIFARGKFRDFAGENQ